MYNRSYGTRRPPKVPLNYSGNAFYRVPYEERREEPYKANMTDVKEEPEICQEEINVTECPCEHVGECPKETKECKKNGFPAIGGKLFPKGLGNEELLILAMILITSGEESNTELLLCLTLLLFC